MTMKGKLRSSTRKDVAAKARLLEESRTESSDSLTEKPKEQHGSINKDIGSIVLLVILYLLQGVPLGLSMGSVPFLLKAKLGYKDLALFSLSGYPYSLKLLWSPIVDSVYVKSIGRRKSWIIPIQLILGIALFLLGGRIDGMLEQEALPINMLAIVFTVIVVLCATQDIAVDGWALTLLDDENKTYASTAQTIGLNTGYFLSFTVFLALNSPEVSNTYFRSVPQEQGLLQLGAYLQFWGLMFLMCDAWLIFFQKEGSSDMDVDSVSDVYKTITKICQMPHMAKLIVVLFIAKIGFIANDTITGLKLLERGFKKEDLALAVLIDFPFQIIFGYYAAKWSSGVRPLAPWTYAFYGRLMSAVISMLVVYYFPASGVVSGFYFFVVITITVLSSFMSTLQFVGLGSYFTKISDPSIGGTYMTLLNTLSNLGGTWPKYFVLLVSHLFLLLVFNQN